MKINKSAPPTTVERPISVDFSREEVLTVLVKAVRDKFGSNLRLDDLSIIGNDNGKLDSVILAGVEILPLTWKTDNTSASTVAPIPKAPLPVLPVEK